MLPDRAPCFHAFLLPLGAPLPCPPCIRHLFRPLIAGDWHAVPMRVVAKHRGAAWALSMGLIGSLSIFPAPGMMVELIGNDGLPALIYMHMPHRLFARLVQLGQRLKCGAGIGLSLESQPALSEQMHRCRSRPDRVACGLCPALPNRPARSATSTPRRR